MQPDERFTHKTGNTWAYVKLLSELLGYSSGGELLTFQQDDITKKLDERGLSTSEVGKSAPTEFGKMLCDYLNFRADILKTIARPNLMNRDQARIEFERLQSKLHPRCPLPMNKQKGEKRHRAFLTCIVNMLTEQSLGSLEFDSGPRALVTITKHNRPVRTLSRWMDGAYPNINNPVAVWEIKEYYGTTTFGSRVADGIYETMLDGLELSELAKNEGIHVKHYLIVDDYFTWWDCGKSYLCRLVDMLHMGLVDEVLFGREVLTRWPDIVRRWLPDSGSPSQK